MRHKVRLTALILLLVYIVAGNVLGFATFICGFDSGDHLFFVFYPCTFFWAFAYFFGPLWTIFGIGMTIGELWMVFVIWKSLVAKAEKIEVVK